MSKFTLKFTGESGQGINSVGEILLKAFKNSNYYVFGYREYPSLIKGGNASYQITISDSPVESTQQKVDIMIAISRFSIDEYLRSIKRGGVLVHSIARLILDKEQKLFVDENEIKIIHLNADQEAIMAGGTKLASNVYLLGVFWNLLGLDFSTLDKEVQRKFGKKQKFLELNKKILKKGFETDLGIGTYHLHPSKEQLNKKPLLSGNEAISLGAIKAGSRAFYAYPMTPASSILSTLANFSKDTKMVVKQAEDEISAIQMTLGSMYVGTRAFTSTSGGGFDLMTESISMSGMTEIPLVVVLAQRPGPATGLPTWSSASDLELAVYSGHGEFPRIVIAASDAATAFYLIQDAFNLAEIYQLPVILLTEKDIAESIYLFDETDKKIEIRRGLMSQPPEDSHRYQFTNSGISPRWLPGINEMTYVTNSDEHDMDGNSIEDAEIAKAMYDKRLQKLETVRDEIPEPIFYGDEDCDLVIVGWGSVKAPALEIVKNSEKLNLNIGYLHYEYMYPLKTKRLVELAQSGKYLLLVENNKTMQLGKMLRSECAVRFNREFGKYDGRPIFASELTNIIFSMNIHVV